MIVHVLYNDGTRMRFEQLTALKGPESTDPEDYHLMPTCEIILVVVARQLNAYLYGGEVL